MRLEADIGGNAGVSTSRGGETLYDVLGCAGSGGERMMGNVELTDGDVGISGLLVCADSRDAE